MPPTTPESTHKDTPENNTLYLANARYIDADTLEIHTGHLAVTPGHQGSTTPADHIPQHAHTIDCAGKLVTRALAVGHHHIYATLARGMPPPDATPTNFIQILERIWWNLDKKLDIEMIRASALAAAVDAAKSGVTFIIDHHASPAAAEGSLHTIANALEAVGIDHLLCYELSDRDGPDRRDAGLRETAEYLTEKKGLVGLHASFTVSDKLLDKAIDLAAQHDTGIHVHAAEAPQDQEHCIRHHGLRCVHRFQRAGALDLPKTILAHCIHLDRSERETLGRAKSWVSQQTESNLNNAVGTPDPTGFEHRVFLGTDGMNSDPLAAAHATFLAGQHADAPSPLAVYRRLRRVHQYLATNGIPGDATNNILILDYDPPTPVTPENWPAHVVYALNRDHIQTVISNGRVIVRNNRSTLVDEAEIAAHAREQAARLWSRL